MSLQRTPPASSDVFVPHQANDSDTPSERGGYVTTRQKRRRGSDHDHREIRNEMSMLSNKLDQYFSELKQQNADLKDSVQFMSEKYDSLLKVLTKVEEDRAEDKKLIAKLEERLESMERKSKLTGIEIRNVPINLIDNKKRETKEDICSLVQCLSKSVDVSLNDCDIKDAYRVTTNKEVIKPIIVELNSVIKKEKILQAVKQFNKNKPIGDKLSTSHLGIPGQTKPVFVSEALTVKTQKIFYMARKFVSEYNYSFCWTSRGIVYLRKAEGELAIRIETEEDLYKLRANQ